ncbi:MAG TPA: hypothetical protein VGG75_19325 [Trebonia sp.]|jgi:hypothetical protein
MEQLNDEPAAGEGTPDKRVPDERGTIRYPVWEQEWTPAAESDPEAIEAIDQRIERYFGPAAYVWHEIASAADRGGDPGRERLLADPAAEDGRAAAARVRHLDWCLAFGPERRPRHSLRPGYPVRRGAYRAHGELRRRGAHDHDAGGKEISLLALRGPEAFPGGGVEFIITA